MMMAGRYEEAYDKKRDEVADYTEDELYEMRGRLAENEAHLSISEKAYLDAIKKELEER